MTHDNVEVKVNPTGVGFCSLLGLLFIGLKLGGVINWSWWWVTCPLWIGIAVFIATLVVLGVVAVFLVLLQRLFGKQ